MYLRRHRDTRQYIHVADLGELLVSLELATCRQFMLMCSPKRGCFVLPSGVLVGKTGGWPFVNRTPRDDNPEIIATGMIVAQRSDYGVQHCRHSVDEFLPFIEERPLAEGRDITEKLPPKPAVG